ncbi:hypothetical protein BO85DRAFT_441730 [Aspergillus piperis CBS 112811]|uniref:Uncharacterized protein n=1 Tax=Aspergillus piperis CBS 112811 TaxID=1448313 RepID=A0A8G1QX88_9EURO|nr:hypothetical protein BO85DRAFT_441730 [Aspergillus piperis CBS 112811]RAH54269.1 hypothetical protein BO85DRAFT_441730 [Aspergillus piperis CBS 112811]
MPMIKPYIRRKDLGLSIAGWALIRRITRNTTARHPPPDELHRSFFFRRLPLTPGKGARRYLYFSAHITILTCIIGKRAQEEPQAYVFSAINRKLPSTKPYLPKIETGANVILSNKISIGKGLAFTLKTS